MLKSLSFQSRSLPYLITFMMLALWAGMVYRTSLNSFPAHFHAWTQSDRYALTIGFLDNGFGLLKPSTPNLWPKYPPEKMPEKLEGITKADLPLSEFIAAQLMQLTGTRQPVFLRGLNLAFSVLGLMMLFGLMLHMGASLPMAWLAVSFALLSPVYAYYLDGFIPGIPALGLTVTAYYFFYRFVQTGKTQFFGLSITLITLAALIRPPVLMALPAFVLASVLISGKKRITKILIISSTGLLVIGLFQLYNRYLAANYGSLFISSLMPAGSLNEFVELLRQSFDKWKFEYFSYTQYLLLALSVALLFIFRYRLLRSKPHFALLLAALVHFFAALAYFVAMAKQFPDHDYYFLESFFIPFVLFTGIGLSLPRANITIRKLLFGLVFVMSTWLMADAALAVREKRYTTQSWDMTETTRRLFEGSAEWLDEKGISRDAAILVLDSYTTNVPLLLMERKGFTVINTTHQNLEASLQLPFDYIMVPNRSLPSDVLRNLPELSEWLVPVANNGRIGLYQFDRSAGPKHLAELILPALVEPLASVPDSITIYPDMEFFELAQLPFGHSPSPRAIAFKAEVESKAMPVSDLLLVVDISIGDNNLFYDSFRLDAFFENAQRQPIVMAYINLPDRVESGSSLKCYLWNAGRNHITLKNPVVEIMNFENLNTYKQ